MLRAHSRLVAATVCVAFLVAACASSSSDDPAPTPDDPTGSGTAESEVPEPDTPPSPEPGQDEIPDPDDADAADDRADVDDVDSAGPPVDPAEVGADELGLIPVLMYHQLREDGSEWDQTPEELRAELTYLFDEGYRPIRTIDLVRDQIDVPAGTTPVVLTFDDSSRGQAYLDDDGQVHPDSAMGILIDVASQYDDVEPVASLYVISSSIFGGGNDGPDILRALHDAGMELGNHTHTHPSLSQVSDTEVQEELATTVAVLGEHVPEAEVATLALPLGQYPQNRPLAAAGSGTDGEYTNEAVLLVGSNPTVSPYHHEFDPLAIPRIQVHADPEFLHGSSWWFTQLERAETYRRYISDGDPDTISFPADRADELDPAFASRANPY